MILAIVNLCPGVGRTTLAVHLAGELALQGRRVALLDLDPGAGALRWSARRRRHELPALFPTQGMSGRGLPGGVAGLGDAVEHVVIDTPAQSVPALRSALAVADRVLLPSRPERRALGGCAATMQMLVEAMAERPALSAAVVYARTGDRLAVASGETVTVCGLCLPVAGAVLPERESFAIGQALGLLAQEVEPAGPAESAVWRLAGEVFGNPAGSVVS